MRTFVRQLRPALVALVVFTVIVGVVYPLLTTVIGQVAFGHRADGSLIRRGGVVVGSELIGQSFTSPEYFHSRPSAAGYGYDGANSSGSNFGPLNPDFLGAIDERVARYRAENGLADDVAVPVDAVTASSSGLDPHISVANARLQASRVAQVRGLDLSVVRQMIALHTDTRVFGFLGEQGVNVFLLNLALDDLARSP